VAPAGNGNDHVVSESDETWTDEEDAEYSKRVGELLLEGHAEFEIEDIAGGEINERRAHEADEK
jgi:hypothetical protein